MSRVVMHAYRDSNQSGAEKTIGYCLDNDGFYCSPNPRRALQIFRQLET